MGLFWSQVLCHVSKNRAIGSKRRNRLNFYAMTLIGFLPFSDWAKRNEPKERLHAILLFSSSYQCFHHILRNLCHNMYLLNVEFLNCDICYYSSHTSQTCICPAEPRIPATAGLIGQTKDLWTSVLKSLQKTLLKSRLHLLPPLQSSEALYTTKDLWPDFKPSINV